MHPKSPPSDRSSNPPSLPLRLPSFAARDAYDMLRTAARLHQAATSPGAAASVEMQASYESNLAKYAANFVAIVERPSEPLPYPLHVHPGAER